MVEVILGLGFWFWGLVLCEFIILICFVESEMEFASAVSLIVFILLLQFLADVPIWQWIKNNPKQLVIYTLIYIVCGLLWSLIKYYFKLSKAKRFIQQQKENWLKDDKKYNDMDISLKDYIDRQLLYSGKFERITLNFDKSIGKLVLWAMLWPPSMIWTLLDEPIRRLFTWLIKDVFIGLYRRMYKSMIENNISE